MKLAYRNSRACLHLSGMFFPSSSVHPLRYECHHIISGCSQSIEEEHICSLPHYGICVLSWHKAGYRQARQSPATAAQSIRIHRSPVRAAAQERERAQPPPCPSSASPAPSLPPEFASAPPPQREESAFFLGRQREREKDNGRAVCA